MLYREIIAVCSEIHTKHINALCGQNVNFFNVTLGGTYNNHRVSRKINLDSAKKQKPSRKMHRPTRLLGDCTS
jgi:sulfite reductase beta subunit-like hemoprotein